MAITAAQLEVRLTSSGAGKVTGELKGLDQAIKATQQGFNTLYQAASDFASKAIAGIQNLSGALGKVGLAGFTALMGSGAKMAWDQVSAVQQATVALGAYERDARKVESVLQDLLVYARSEESGGLFWRQDLFKAAQGLRVMGAETSRLTDYVKIMSRAVGLGTMGWDELGRVIGRVGSTGRLTSIDFEMLQKAGFQLDESIRNTAVTWDELFAALDRGIPADALEGQFGTIQTRLEFLKSAVIDLGAALLGIDRETMRFTEGGLGAYLVASIDMAIDALGRLRPAASLMGEAVAVILSGIDGLAQGFQALPGWIQSGVVGILGMITAWGMLRQAIAATTAAMRLMGLGAFTGLFSPLGLAITAAAVGIGLLVQSFRKADEASQSLTNSITGLNDVLETLRTSGEVGTATRVNALLKEIEAIGDAVNATNLDDLNEALGTSFESALDFDTSKIRSQLQEAADISGDTVDTITENLQRLNTNQKDIYLDWVNDLLATIKTTNDETNLDDVLNRILITPASEVPGVMDAATASIEDTVAATNTLADALDQIDHALANPEESLHRLDLRFAAMHRRLRDEAWKEWVAQFEKLSGLDDVLARLNLTEHGTAASRLAENMLNLNAVMSDTFRIVVGGTDAIGNQMGALMKWADELIAVQGEWSKLDELVQAGLIDGTSGVFDDDSTYARAQLAYNEIAEANLDIQDKLLAIQAQQAPVLAQNAEAMREYVDELYRMYDGTEEGARNQLAALAMMDSATQSRLQGFMDLGIQMRELGTDGEAIMQGMVDGMIAMGDPMVAVLENLGLINAETGQINFDKFNEAGNDIQRLTESIDALVNALAQAFDLDIEVRGKEEIDEAAESARSLADAPGQKDFEVRVTTPEGGIAGAARSLMDRLLGRETAEPVSVPVSLDVPDAVIPDLSGEITDVSVIGPPPVIDVEAKVTSIDTSDLGPLQGPGLDDGIQPFASTITFEVEDNATAPIEVVRAAVEAVPKSITTWVLVDGHVASIGYLNGVQAAADAIPTSVTTWTLVAGWTEAIGYLNGVQNAAEAIPDSATTWTLVAGHLDAITQLNAVRAAAEAIPTSVTVAVNAVASSMPSFSAHASGGFVRSDFQLVGEHGPELVQLPYGSYVHTAAETRQMMTPTNYGFGASAGGGTFAPTVNITVNAETDADAEEIAELAGQRTMMALQHIINDQRRGKGMQA